ncbi:SCO family protein [Persicirhabdus sediminis]|uniref:SCO family protein n=1 Tax=Persicirhabdus sediminis TaxID=454144 RepID=A0A8J7MC26_9BACT|nr:SCO family protein [Persicirhabdus sediminis]MBK1789739.1 SCO family protein [Persicirhabdus sediminis]
MKLSSKIYLIYFSVAVISIGILAGFYLSQRADSFKEAEEPVALVEAKVVGEPYIYTTLTKSLKGQNQAGEDVDLLDLKGKVWVFAQFYSRCPECAKDNIIVLRELQEMFRDNPKFHIVSITVDPEMDTPEWMADFSNQLSIDTSKWWLMRTDKDELLEYGQDQLKYNRFEKSATPGQIAHDMRIAVFDDELQMRGMFNLFNIDQSKEPERYAYEKDKLVKHIEWCLAN